MLHDNRYSLCDCPIVETVPTCVCSQLVITTCIDCFPCVWISCNAGKKKRQLLLGWSIPWMIIMWKKKQREEKNNWAKGWVIFARDGKLSDSFHSSWFLPTIYHRTIKQMTNEITQWDQAGKPKRK